MCVAVYRNGDNVEHLSQFIFYVSHLFWKVAKKGCRNSKSSLNWSKRGKDSWMSLANVPKVSINLTFILSIVATERYFLFSPLFSVLSTNPQVQSSTSTQVQSNKFSFWKRAMLKHWHIVTIGSLEQRRDFLQLKRKDLFVKKDHIQPLFMFQFRILLKKDHRI